jgi:hypothetical protein
MRLPIAALLALLAVPATAYAGTIGLENGELVYRADPGRADQLIFTDGEPGVLSVNPLGDKLQLGPGCAEQDLGIQCPTAGVTGLTVIADDGRDDIQVFAALPLTVYLGAGDDGFDISGPPRVTLDAGPGKDSGAVAADAANIIGGEGDDGIELEGYDRSPGPYTVYGGPGDDPISLRHRGAGMTLSGDEGDDRLFTTAQGPAPVTLLCGPGADRWTAAPRDTPGDGCAPHLAGITPATVSPRFREGALSAQATGSVTLKRRKGLSGYAYETLARRRFAHGAGPLRLTLRRTHAGRRWLPRRPKVFVTVLTRSGGDRGEVTYRSKVR